MIDSTIDQGERRPARGRRDHRTRVRLAARQAEHLYPGPLGRLVAHELSAYADGEYGASPAGLAELVIREVLDRSLPRARRVRSGEFDTGGRTVR